MSNVARIHLNDTDIKNLPIKEKRYLKVVGTPKELSIKVYPGGTKTFVFRTKNDKIIKIGKYRYGIFSVNEARKKAFEILKELESGKDIDIIKGNSKKYLFKNYFNIFIQQKEKNGLSIAYLKKIIQMFEKYILPAFGDRDIKTIKHSELYDNLNALFNPYNPRASRLETIRRLIRRLHEVFNLALVDRYIDYDPSSGLEARFPAPSRFNQKYMIDTRFASLISDEELKEFLNDLLLNSFPCVMTMSAIWIQILCVNRPSNTVEAKWADIDLENGIWTIPADEMKMRLAHEIALSTQAIKIFKYMQRFRSFNRGDNDFVFCSEADLGHLNRDSLSSAIRNLGSTNKYRGKVTSHGFRATFRTICTLNKTKLLDLGITEEVIESCLAHKETNQVKFAYERQKATIEQKRILMQWYSDYLFNLLDLPSKEELEKSNLRTLFTRD